MAIYKDFVAGYESGMTMIEIAKRNNVSERTIYRYKAYYDKITKSITSDHFAGISKMVRCDAFGQKMNGGVLWQKIKRRKLMLQ